MTQLFNRLCVAILCLASLATGLQWCETSLDCDTFALCEGHFCDCITGWKNNYRNGKLYCTDDSTTVAVVVPIVVTLFVSIVVAIIIYCILKKRRLARATQQTIWVQCPQATVGVPVAAQSYPGMYPMQQYQQYQQVAPPPYVQQGSMPPYTQQGPMQPYNQQGYNTTNQNNPTNATNQNNPTNTPNQNNPTNISNQNNPTTK